jgi:hypothetical protein
MLITDADWCACLQDPPSWHPASDEVKAAAIKAKELCASKGTDLARIAIKHWLKWVDCCT